MMCAIILVAMLSGVLSVWSSSRFMHLYCIFSPIRLIALLISLVIIQSVFCLMLFASSSNSCVSLCIL